MLYQRSVIVACDVSLDYELETLVSATWNIPHIGAYKVGFDLVISYGLPRIVGLIRSFPEKIPIIYDHQKGGTDTPPMGSKFAKVVRSSGANAVILFPLTGPVVAEKWIKTCQDEGLGVIVGGHMTHEKFLESEGGYISDAAPFSIYTTAAKLGVTNFVVPGNKPELIRTYRQHLEGMGVDTEKLQLFAPGFITQGGDISEAGKVAGERWHAIVGSAIYEKHTWEAMHESALQLVQQISVD
ncbi:MAG: hypothetical protein A3H64_02680 [Candidatus Ryanbacteria bacterium RIFCSPLOWO2_02_FULL_45_11c]|uniref:Orotidine 5'-phosphate decarboxylase domain-containing protein n=1 Tax=Candidatus Ryanbacteria bacterium RIFCSPLOWO2_02_FULL_45_11c TaxID=1802128 RepID=A0A1G2H3F0_9BACT|nr:MAG: hypothetical protein A3H64_02680 [Candidatus Ryanbacteria bacterium RIFCSPLOWO2_02_FULL_45_11c]